MKKSPREILFERRGIWKGKKILRNLYRNWYRIIGEALKPGNTLELGGGSGNLKEFFTEALTSDIVFAPWLDAVLDAHRLPFKNESLSNIVLFDVLHHLGAPLLFFHEAERVLKPGGRIVLMEPYVSWASFLVYRFLHHEGMNYHVDPFRTHSEGKRKDPFYGNQAIPTLLIEKNKSRFMKEFSGLKIVRCEFKDFLTYPLSGGFHNRRLFPSSLWHVLDRIERMLTSLGRYLAFRQFVVLEKV
jgi:SAM-dependent methyltransferase